jgi:DNA (cytosine-5)-methyltransferase 1
MNETTMRIENVDKFFSVKYLHMHKVLNTITGGEKNMLYDEKRTLSKSELCKGGSYPNDYNFLDVKSGYLIGMSVPPVMTAQIATEIYLQWLSKI